MKTYALAAVCFLLAGTPQVLAQDEIVIEMTGDATAAEQTSLWDFNAPQLTRRLRGKTREQVLYAVPVVSDKDRIVRGGGKE